jgi:CheY-like chemotaxis protein
MLVKVSGQVYSIPLTQVEETLSISEKDISTDDKGHYLNLRDEQIPLIVLNDLLAIKNQKPPKFTPEGDVQIIIVLDQGNRIAFAVDKIVRREEILIKSLGSALKKLKYIIGGSIMADGQVLLVLDVHQIIQESMKSVVLPELSPNLPEAFADKSKIQQKTRKKREKVSIKGRQPSLLVVDDSLSIRKYLSGILSGKGFVTDTSRNGNEALELLKNKDFDIVITDLEMPQMSGYELIETIRQDDRFDDLPIIVLTGRAGENFKNLTTELGADSYIVKPFKDRELFEQINNFIRHEE